MQNDPSVVQVYQNEVKRNIVRCASLSKDTPDKYKVNAAPLEGRDLVPGLPFILRDLLPIVAKNHHVIVTGASYNYRDMVMNFVCNLRRLGIYQSLVIAAFDEDMVLCYLLIKADDAFSTGLDFKWDYQSFIIRATST